MHCSARFALLLSILLLNIPVSAQQAQTITTPLPDQTATTPSPTTNDPQAVSVVDQALAVAGGTAAIRAIQDYTATGNITFPSQQDAQGPVTLQGLNGTEFRMDANLPTGIRSWAVSDGVMLQKAESGIVSQSVPQDPVSDSNAYPYQTPLFPASIAFPYLQLASVVSDPIYSISYQGLVEINGRSVHHIQIDRGPADSASRVRDVFIDVSSLQVVTTTELIPKNSIYSLHYSDYRPIGGILMPFSIIEEIGGQLVWSIQLTQIQFNTGLKDTAFEVQ